MRRLSLPALAPRRTRKVPDLVTLDDEHEQTIELWSPSPRKWWWAFHDLPENDKEWAGPFKTRIKAIADAADFCETTAVDTEAAVSEFQHLNRRRG